MIYIPSYLKVADIKPIHKKDKKIWKYWPVSILPVI